MRDETFIIGSDFGGTTLIHPIALICTILMGILMVFLPRKYVIIPLMLAGIFIPIKQRIVIASIDFFMLRFLVLFGWFRLILRSELNSLKMNKVDKLLILWVITGVVSNTILWQTWGAFLYRLGLAFDGLGLYFLFRLLFRNISDINKTIDVLAIISLIVAGLMIVEYTTGKNIFSIFGGVPETTVIRDDRLRCQGAFLHPILAGSFGSALMPLFVSYFRVYDQKKVLSVLGSIAATIIIILSSSSGPIIAYLMALVGLFMWPFHKEMLAIQWVVLCGLIIFQMVMNAPIWAIFIHIKVVGASTGWHRYFLIDQFINHFDEWWLFGVKYTAHWGDFLFDVTNQFIRIGVDGGIITLTSFIALIVICFRKLGKLLKSLDNQNKIKIFIWGFGVSLFTHIVSFMSVTYFDQMIIIWYLTLGIISALYELLYGQRDYKNKNLLARSHV